MLFLKSKPKSDEFLPPPPPFPSMEFEDELKTEPSQIGDLEHDDSLPKFADMFNDIDKSFVQKKAKAGLDREKTRLKLLKIKKRLSKFKQMKPNPKAAKLKAGQKNGKESGDYPKINMDDYDFPKDLEEASDKDFVSNKLDFDLEPRPQEMIEAEDEIKSAIADIKGHEKKSLFGRLFGSRVQEQKTESSQLMQENPEMDNLSKIKNKLDDARQSLMNFDLNSARKDYADIMSLYNELKPEEQAKVYYEIKNLYYERKSAEGLKY